MKLSASRRSDQLTGALFAILIQAALLALLILSRAPVSVPEKLAHELTLILPRLPKTEPAPAPARAAGPPRPLQAPLLLVPQMPRTAVPLAAPPDLSHLGQSIFGCAPEAWSNLPAEQRARCPRPGEGVAVLNAPDLLHPPKSHVKDEATLQEQWDEDHWTPGPCPPAQDLIYCNLSQFLAEQKRANIARRQIAQQKAAALQAPKPPLPERIGIHPQ